MTQYHQPLSEEVAAFEERVRQSLDGNTVDCVILGYQEYQLKVLLLKWKYEDVWSLPGGYIHTDEGLDEAAHRILRDRTGLDSIFLKQFHTFGKKSRELSDTSRHRLLLEKIIRRFPFKEPDWLISWAGKRFITTGYFALVNIESTSPQPDFFSEKCVWINIKEVPELLQDHNEIVDGALSYLKKQLNYLPIGLSLLPEKFTMNDMQKLYEAILQRSLDRANFQRKILKLDFLVRLEKQMTGR